MNKSANGEMLFSVEYGLEEFLSRLSRGMTLTGRIVDVLDNNQYVLRIWGYNLLTESSKVFKKDDVIKLDVREVSPRLVLDFSHVRNYTKQNPRGEMDMFV